MSNTVPATTRPTRRRIYFDPKWILILGIVLFMVIFQIFPILYLVVKAFFPEGTFSLNTFERLYTYEMNWGALTNTLIAAFATMVRPTSQARGKASSVPSTMVAKAAMSVLVSAPQFIS